MTRRAGGRVRRGRRPRGPAGCARRVAAAAEHRRDHRLRPQQRLHPHQRAPGPLVGLPVSPHRPRCSAPAATVSSGTSRSRTTAPSSGVCRRLVSQASSCQRTRSTVAAGVSGSAHRQIRCSSSPAAVWAVTPSRVHASPWPAKVACSRSARPRAANAAASTRSTGGSSSASTVSSSGGRRRSGGRGSSPRASRWQSTASAPNRDATSAGSSAANAPRLRSPRRRRRSTRAERSMSGSRSSSSTPSAARKAGVSPGATATARRAASTAANSPSANPACTSTPVRAATWSTSRSAAVSSPPNQLAGPREGSATRPGRRISTPGASSSTATTTGSNARASRSGSGARTASSGQRAWASRRRSPRRTPCVRATAEHASTRPATNTAAGWCGGTPAACAAAVTGQSGDHSASTRTARSVIRPT